MFHLPISKYMYSLSSWFNMLMFVYLFNFIVTIQPCCRNFFPFPSLFDQLLASLRPRINYGLYQKCFSQTWPWTWTSRFRVRFTAHAQREFVLLCFRYQIKTHYMVINWLANHTGKKKHTTKARLADFYLNPFTFVGYRNNCFFSHTNPYILAVTQQSPMDIFLV